MRLSLPAGRSPLRLGAAALGAVAVAGAALSPLPSTATGTGAGTGTASYDGSAPALFSPAPASARMAAPAESAGRSRLVVLDPSALPDASGRVGLPLDGADATARVEATHDEPAFTAWSGTLEGEALSSFTLVQVGDVFRGSVISPDGVHTLDHAEGDTYWLTEVAPREMSSADDSAHVDAPDAGAPAPDAGVSRGAASAKRGTRIGVMFGYTEAAKAVAGGTAEIKSAAALVLTQTNEAFANSGVNVTLRLKGVVKAKGGKESGDAVKDAFRVSRPRDGHFDNLQRVRRRHGADLIHLFTSGDPLALCGGGLIPLSPRQANPAAGASTSFLECLPYLVATHELGHNLGADHIHYAGIDHFSQLPYSYGYYNVPGNYISVMSYYAPCEDAGVYTCVRVPYFSSPQRTYDGQPMAFDQYTDNAKVIRKIAPRVARYVR